MRVQLLSKEDSLEEKMATHSEILDRKIPWTEEPVRLQSMRWKRDRNDWANEPVCTHTHIPFPPRQSPWASLLFAFSQAGWLARKLLTFIFFNKYILNTCFMSCDRKRLRAFQVALAVKNLPVNAGNLRNMCFISGHCRSPGGMNGNWLQYSCVENHIDRGAWQAAVHGITKCQKWLKWINTYTHSHCPSK